MSYIERLVIPPGGPLLLLVVGWGLARRWPRLGRGLMVLGLLVLVTASTPKVGAVLLRSLEDTPIWEPGVGHDDVEAIVVLGAGVAGETPEYGGLTLGPLSLERVRHASRLQAQTGLPIVVTGGSARPGATAVAELMREALEQDLGAEVRWTEGKSATTWENAARCRSLLDVEGVRRIALVTHAWHMPRAQLAFERHGFEVVPAPTMFHGVPPEGLSAWLPTARAMRRTSWALHEFLGYWVYDMREH